MKRIVATLCAAAFLLAVVLPAGALADSSSCQAYNPQLCSVSTTSSTGPTSTATLPFTGLDIALLVAGGVFLLGTGLAVRVAARRVNN
jgi:hypothetical protein